MQPSSAARGSRRQVGRGDFRQLAERFPRAAVPAARPVSRALSSRLARDLRSPRCRRARARAGPHHRAGTGNRADRAAGCALSGRSTSRFDAGIPVTLLGRRSSCSGYFGAATCCERVTRCSIATSMRLTPRGCPKPLQPAMRSRVDDVEHDLQPHKRAQHWRTCQRPTHWVASSSGWVARCLTSRCRLSMLA